MMRLKLGDIFELPVRNGLAYLQYVYRDSSLGELICVLPGIYENSQIKFNDIVIQEGGFLVFFPLSAATKSGIVAKIGNYSDTSAFTKPSFMRDPIVENGSITGWHIVNTDTWERTLVTSLSAQQKLLSPWGIWNDTLLREKIDEGWSLDNWK
jgi:hypothetical protein